MPVGAGPGAGNAGPDEDGTMLGGSAPTEITVVFSSCSGPALNMTAPDAVEAGSPLERLKTWRVAPWRRRPLAGLETHPSFRRPGRCRPSGHPSGWWKGHSALQHVDPWGTLGVGVGGFRSQRTYERRLRPIAEILKLGAPLWGSLGSVAVDSLGLGRKTVPRGGDLRGGAAVRLSRATMESSVRRSGSAARDIAAKVSGPTAARRSSCSWRWASDRARICSGVMRPEKSAVGYFHRTPSAGRRVSESRPPS